MGTSDVKRGRFRFGTSSWSEASWRGVFYPEGLPTGEQLSYYATRFDTVEADVTYYRVPDARLVGGWERKVPADFRLSAKFPRSIVHGGQEATPDPAKVLVPDAVREDLERFLANMALLGEKCGPLVLQFPYFNQKVFPRAETFFRRLETFLDALPRSFRYGVEVRNKAWIGDELLGLLRARNVALVWVDLAYLPHPAELAASKAILTADFAYARLIGDRKQIDALTTTFDKLVVDQSERLARWAELLRATLDAGHEVYTYANNHYAGHAPATIRDLARRVGVER
ncbi:MAG: DUF72 domain-containing protein [Planctomycetes bacterium]|nr:DUF72 domain-containing protein [Planctomycetota bacterium]